MARICEDWYPKGSYKGQKDDGFYMDDNLKAQLDILIKNVVNDWDFTILITGGGEVRVGKSVLELQIMAYWCYMIEKVHKIKVPFDVKENIVFQWQRLIESGNKLGEKSKYCVIGYDEAGETMEGSKSATRELRAVRDYLRECGQYNFLNILVLPEFFDLPKGIAITRSTLLLDVYYSADEGGMFERGFFKFYSRRNKKLLYMKGKKELNYNAHPYNFTGRFYNFYPIDEQQYREAKKAALKNRETNTRDRVMDLRNAAWLALYQSGLTQVEICEKMKALTGLELPQTTLNDALEVGRRVASEVTRLTE